MKTLHVAALVAVAALATTGFSQGRPGMGGPPMGGPGGGFGRGPRSPQETADRQTQMMTQMLGLNPAQAKKIHDIIFKSATETKRIRDAQTAAINKMLTPDQQKKMAAMRGGGMGGGMRGGMGGPGGMRRGG